jgi:hypothetical protein
MAQHETEILGSSDLDALVFWLLLLLTVAVACLSALWSLSTLQLGKLNGAVLIDLGVEIVPFDIKQFGSIPIGCWIYS